MAQEKKKPPYLLIVLLPIVAIGVVALLRDRGARQDAADAFALIDKATQAVEHTSPEEVQKLIGQAPDEPLDVDAPRLGEKYTWRGALQTYYIYVSYSKGDPPFLRDVYQNEMP